jgi:hypothetical protein
MNPDPPGNGGHYCTAMDTCGPKFGALADGLAEVILSVDSLKVKMDIMHNDLLSVLAYFGKTNGQL